MMSAKRSGKGAGARKEAGPSTWTIDYYVTAEGSVPVLDWVRSLPEPKRVAWLAFVEFALVPQGKDIEQSGYVKSLGKGLFELARRPRRRRTGPGLRHQLVGLPRTGRPRRSRDLVAGVLHPPWRQGRPAALGAGQGR